MPNLRQRIHRLDEAGETLMQYRKLMNSGAIEVIPECPSDELAIIHRLDPDFQIGWRSVIVRGMPLWEIISTLEGQH